MISEQPEGRMSSVLTSVGGTGTMRMGGTRMRRKFIANVNRRYGNEPDRDSVIALLLKRRCQNTDQIIEYLLSAILEQTKDDILGELQSYEDSLDIKARRR